MMFNNEYSEISQNTPPIMVAGYGTDQSISNDPSHEQLRQLMYRGTQTPSEHRKHWINLLTKEINLPNLKTKKAWSMGFFDNIEFRRSVPMTDKGDSGGPLLQINEDPDKPPFYLLGTVIGGRRVNDAQGQDINVLQTFNKREVRCINDVMNNIQNSPNC